MNCSNLHLKVQVLTLWLHQLCDITYLFNLPELQLCEISLRHFMAIKWYKIMCLVSTPVRCIQGKTILQQFKTKRFETSPVIQWLKLQCREPWFDPWSLELDPTHCKKIKIWHATTKIKDLACHNQDLVQRNTYILKYKSKPKNTGIFASQRQLGEQGS